MSSLKKAFGLILGASALAFTAPGLARAQEVAETDEPVSSREIVVIGEIVYRDRSEATAPTLEYGLDYFQRFEPLTVGDALKRVPSVAFLSDVLESDGVRLRGLDPAYTQILINGEQVPGSGSGSGAFGSGVEGSFFVDRIPAELIERVEIVRSASANRSGDALAGAINIVLRDSYSLEGGFVRAGVLYWENDETWGETIGGVWGGAALGGRLLLGANLQDRHNPKDKFSGRFDQPGGTLVNIEDQTDVRDGTDYSFNFAYEAEIGPGEFSLDGLYVRTDRTENEDSIEYRSGLRNNANLLTLNDNNVDITQDSWSLNGEYEFDMAGGETEIRLGYASFKNEEFEFEDESEFLRDTIAFPENDRFTGDQTTQDLEDAEWRLTLDHERDLGAVELEFGVQAEWKERDTLTQERRQRTTFANNTVNQPLARPVNVTLPAFPAFEAVPGGDNTIERTRIDPYVQLSGERGAMQWEAGLRFETTETDIIDRTAARTTSSSYETLLPSTPGSRLRRARCGGRASRSSPPRRWKPSWATTTSSATRSLSRKRPGASMSAMSAAWAARAWRASTCSTGT